MKTKDIIISVIGFILIVVLFIIYIMRDVRGFVWDVLLLIIALSIWFSRKNIIELWIILKYKTGFLFGRDVFTKYAKLISAIFTIEDKVEIIEKTRCNVMLELYNISNKPYMRWEIYRPMDDKDYYLYKYVTITCYFLTEDYWFPISKRFDAHENQTIIFQTMLHKINEFELLQTKKGKS